MTDTIQPNSDFPATLFARVVKANPAITYVGMSQEGDIQFQVPLQSLGLKRTLLSRISLLRTKFFVDWVGEVLLRQNLALFADALERLPAPDYDRAIHGFTHRHFGMMIDENGVVQFQFHASLIQRILVEEWSEVL